jgi:hypothetical protein
VSLDCRALTLFSRCNACLLRLLFFCSLQLLHIARSRVGTRCLVAQLPVESCLRCCRQCHCMRHGSWEGMWRFFQWHCTWLRVILDAAALDVQISTPLSLSLCQTTTCSLWQGRCSCGELAEHMHIWGLLPGSCYYRMLTCGRSLVAMHIDSRVSPVTCLCSRLLCVWLQPEQLQLGVGAWYVSQRQHFAGHLCMLRSVSDAVAEGECTCTVKRMLLCLSPGVPRACC